MPRTSSEVVDPADGRVSDVGVMLVGILGGHLALETTAPLGSERNL